MNRRTLIKGSLMSSVLTCVTPVCAALVENESQVKPNDLVDPYDAVKKIYDEFVSPKPDSEFIFDEPNFSEKQYDYDKVFCKMISPACEKHQYHDVWLVFHDAKRFILDTEIRNREIIVSQLPSKEVQKLSKSKEKYDVEKTLKSSWRRSGKHALQVREFRSKESINQNFETGGMFRATSQQCDNTELLVLARFFSLITG